MSKQQTAYKPSTVAGRHQKQALPSAQQSQQQQQQQSQQQQQPPGQGFKLLGLQLHPGSSVVSYVYIKRQKAQDGHSISNALYVTGMPLGVDEEALQAIFQLFGAVEDIVMHPSKVNRLSQLLSGPLELHRSACTGLQGHAAGTATTAVSADPLTRRAAPQIHHGCHAVVLLLLTTLSHACPPTPVCLQRSAAVVFESPEGVTAAMKQGGSRQLVQYELPPPEGPLGLKSWVAQHKAARPGNLELQKQVWDRDCCKECRGSLLCSECVSRRRAALLQSTQ
jgi:hypothetical protein